MTLQEMYSPLSRLLITKTIRMTPIEKAVQLVQQMYLNGSTDSCEIYRENAANRTALIAVGEIIKAIKDDNFYILGETNANEIIEYWQQVKTELHKPRNYNFSKTQ